MTDSDAARGREAYAAEGLKTLVVLVFLPALPIAVGFNVMGIAGRLSGLPGVSEDGGLVPALAVLVYVGVFVALIGGVGTAAAGGTLPGPIDYPGEPTPTPTPNPEPTPTPTPTTETPTRVSAGTPKPTATPTPTPEPSEAERRQQELAAFEQTYNERIDSTLDRDVQDTYLLATGYRENEDGELVLWAVHWECRNLQAINDQQANLAANYAITVGQHDGAMPDRLQVVGVSDFEPLPGEAFPVEMEDAKAVQSGEIDEAEYLKRWALEEHAPSAKENETAYNMVVDEQNEALADKAWHDDADEPGGCPGPANVHPNNARDEG